MQPDHAAADGAALSPSDRRYLAVEFGSLFFALPGLASIGKETLQEWFAPFPWMLPLLFSAAVICGLLLMVDRTFDRRQLWNAGKVWTGLPRVLLIWAVAMGALYAIVRWSDPAALFRFPRENPTTWALVMVLYPLLSVLPQNLVYRPFIMHRYRRLFGEEWGSIWASAVAFSWAHIIFQNIPALMLTAVGGLLFAVTYQRSRSMLLCSIEHALYGCGIFTLGLGSYLYAGR